MTDDAANVSPDAETVSAQPAEEAPKPRRRRRSKEEIEAARAAEAEASASAGEGEGVQPAKRRRGRPRKSEQAPKPEAEGSPENVQAEASATPSGEEGGEAQSAPRRRRGRPRKSESADSGTLTIEEMTKMTEASTVASSESGAAPAQTLEGVTEQEGADQTAEGGRASRRRKRGDRNAAASGTAGSSVAQVKGQNRRQNGQQGRRRGRHQDFSAEPSVSREELAALKVADLRAKAAELGLDYAGVRKGELVEAVYEATARAEGFRPIEGILEIGNEGYGWIRTGNYMEGDDDAFVHQQLIRSLGLRPGDRVSGTVGPGRAGGKYPPLQSVITVNGQTTENLKVRPRFRDLTPVFPNERLVMECGKDSITGRAIDLVSPIGKGQRGLIVSPPKAGKTTVLKKICQSIATNNPEVHLFCLLVDERPEEVTDMQRSIKGEVVASTFDMPADNHTRVSELVIEHAKRLVELGEDVVVVLDSITRLARAYNLAAPASGRILSGGVDSAALYPPKKFLGAARNIENGGSLTIIASALVDTGSKMDEVIFEEFKGTGNMELKLDRELADKRIFPAIDPVASGTRNEDLLIEPDYQPLVWGIRRVLANMNNVERAARALVSGLKGTDNNRDFLIKSARKAAQQPEYIA